MSKPAYETNAPRAWLSLVAGSFAWAVSATAAHFVYFRVVFGFPMEQASEMLLTVLSLGSINFALAVVAGLILWMLLRQVSGRRWRVAVLIGAVSYFLVPNVVAALAMLAFMPGFDLRGILRSGLLDIGATLAVGAIVGGVMWRVAYRRVATPPVTDVFT